MRAYITSSRAWALSELRLLMHRPQGAGRLTDQTRFRIFVCLRPEDAEQMRGIEFDSIEVMGCPDPTSVRLAISQMRVGPPRTGRKLFGLATTHTVERREDGWYVLHASGRVVRIGPHYGRFGTPDEAISAMSEFRRARVRVVAPVAPA